MPNYFKNKKIFITGATSGIGEDLVYVLDSLGAQLAICGRNTEKLKVVKARCSNQIKTFIADVKNPDDMKKIALELLSLWGHVDIILANAGVGGLNPAYDFSWKIHQEIFNTNLLGTVNTIIPFLPSFLERRMGHIVAISSLAAIRGLPNGSSYSASKAGLATLLESFRLDLAPYSIDVTTIYPGFVKSKMTDHHEFQMPFKIDTRDSSYKILKAISKKKKEFSYPWQMNLLAKINYFLPNFIYDWFAPKLTKAYKSKKLAKIF